MWRTKKTRERDARREAYAAERRELAYAEEKRRDQLTETERAQEIVDSPYGYPVPEVLRAVAFVTKKMQKRVEALESRDV